jgi:hypothetical protein
MAIGISSYALALVTQQTSMFVKTKVHEILTGWNCVMAARVQ